MNARTNQAAAAVLGLLLAGVAPCAGCGGAPTKPSGTVWTMPLAPGASASGGARAAAPRRAVPVLEPGAGDGVFDLFPALGSNGEPLYSDWRDSAPSRGGEERARVGASPSAGPGDAADGRARDDAEADEERGWEPWGQGQAAGGPRWWTDEIAALLAAQRLGRPLVLDFWASWCPGCHVLDSQTLGDPAVRATLEAWFVPVKLDVSDDTPQNKARLELHRVYALPAVLVLDAQGRELDRLSSVPSPEAFLAWLEAARAKLARRSEGQRAAGQ